MILVKFLSRHPCFTNLKANNCMPSELMSRKNTFRNVGQVTQDIHIFLCWSFSSERSKVDCIGEMETEEESFVQQSVKLLKISKNLLRPWGGSFNVPELSIKYQNEPRSEHWAKKQGF